MIISAIVATAKNNVIGKDNEIPWYLPADLKHFKKTTLDHHIIMGRNCYHSIGRPLPRRTNVVVTRNPFFVATGCLVAHSIEEALLVAQQNGETEAFIIGGGQIYEQSVELWDKLYLTEVDLETEGDVFFPKMNVEDWREIGTELHEADAKNKYNYIFRIFERKV